MVGRTRILASAVVGVWMLVVGLVGSLSTSASSPQVGQRSLSAWQSLRTAYPYHVQLVGLGKSDEVGSRVLIVAEPPPDMGTAQLQKLLPGKAGPVRVLEHKIGFDGWVRDAVVVLPPMTDAERVELLAKLHHAVFGTTYRAQALELPPRVSKTYAGPSLDISVSAAELHSWLVRDDPVMRSFANETRWSTANTNGDAAQKVAGVFRSIKSGLVVWSFPRGGDLSHYTRDARKFFLDADLILGAIASDKLVWIVGRERVLTPIELPPLRTEVVMTIAAHQSQELSQSYERNRVFAGPTADGWDWAPILLSDALLHTEFGSLLNITDQILKSWSLYGEIDYVDFPYPKPKERPAFKTSLFDVFEEHGSVLFNWNTLGVGYRMTFEKNVEVVAANRTGALPVIYRAGPDQDIPVAEQEQTAYDYFARSGNPDLARVVQYATLYQIFRALQVTAVIDPPTASLRAGNEVLARSTKAALLRIAGLGDEEILELGTQRAREFQERFAGLDSSELLEKFRPILPQLVEAEVLSQQEADLLIGALERNEPMSGEVSAILDGMVGLLALNRAATVWSELEELKQWVGTMQSEFGAGVIEKLSAIIANPRAERGSPEEIGIAFAAYKEGRTQTRTQRDLLIQGMALGLARQLAASSASLAMIADIEDVKRKYVGAFAGDGRLWIRTPSIVLSKGTGRASQGTGGHSVGAAIGEFRIGKGVKRVRKGTVKVEVGPGGRKVIYYHPDDVAKIGDLSRPLALRKSEAELTRILSGSSRAIRTPAKALERSRRPQPPAAGLIHVGAEPRFRALTALEAGDNRAVASLNPTSFIVERSGGAYHLRNASTGAVQDSPSLTATIETLGDVFRTHALSDREVLVVTQGLRPREARFLLESANLQAARLTGKRAQAQVLVSKSGRSIGASVKKVSQRYDWSKFTIDARPPERITEGRLAGQFRQEFAVNVPAKAANSPPLLVRIYLYVKERLAQPVLAKCQEAIKTVLGRKSLADKTLAEMMSNIRRELKRIDPELEFLYDGEDWIVIGLNLRDSHSGPSPV